MFDYDKFGDSQMENFFQEEKNENENANEIETESENFETVQNEPIKKFKETGSANIVVVGVGGGGGNAVNNMIRAEIKSASFIVMNTDTQALNMSLASPENKVQLGENQTHGLGAGSDPEVGRLSAEESREKITEVLDGVDLLFITAGMGGGTGTGAAPVIAEVAKSMGILTVAVVTKPFTFEGIPRLRNAEAGIQNLKNFVDTLLVIPNQKLLEVLDPNVSFKRAFEIADDVLRQGVQGVADVITNPSHINLDFADVRTILTNKGLAHMGIGSGKGEKRVIDAVRGAVFSPLLETDIEGATGIIVNIVGGDDMLLSEVNEACDIVRQVVDPSANIILGTGFVPEKKDIEITIIATGFNDKNAQIAVPSQQKQTRSVASTFASMSAVAADKDESAKKKISSPVTATSSQEKNKFGEPLAGRNLTRSNSQPVQSSSASKSSMIHRPAENANNAGSSRIEVERNGNNVPDFIKRMQNR